MKLFGCDFENLLLFFFHLQNSIWVFGSLLALFLLFVPFLVLATPAILFTCQLWKVIGRKLVKLKIELTVVDLDALVNISSQVVEPFGVKDVDSEILIDHRIFHKRVIWRWFYIFGAILLLPLQGKKVQLNKFIQNFTRNRSCVFESLLFR